jgi:two-component system chemotaxis response regulator CheB
MKKVRVLVVDDSLTIRRRFCEILAADPQLEVIGEAEDGRRAIELCEQLRPDVITLDMVMPGMGGLAATEYIMAYRPTPILVVSASMNRGELFNTYDALAAGAIDVLEKPTLDNVDTGWERRFVATVKLIAKIKVITHVRARLSGTDRAVAAVAGQGAMSPTSKPHDQPRGRHYGVVAYARDREPIESLRGQVIMAPPGRHLSIGGGRLHLNTEPPRHSCRPSVDVLFESLAVDRGAEVLACLLTGMGRDGAAGLLAIRRAGGFTVAQDESTSVIYGMPREAVLLSAAQLVLPLDQIGPQIAQLLRDNERRSA